MTDVEPKPDETEQPAPNFFRTLLRRRSLWFVLLFVVIGSVGLLKNSLLQPLSKQPKPTRVEIPVGATPFEIGSRLEQRRIIRSGMAYAIYLMAQKEKQPCLPGRYVLSPDMQPIEILRQLRLGPGNSPYDTVRVVFPEGYTIAQIAKRLDEKGITDEKAFLRVATQSQVLEIWNYDFPKPVGSLEGYLFPDTYDFLPNSSPEKVLDQMLSNFSKRFVRPYRQQMEQHKHEIHELVTIASLIEREARVAQDRPRIAGVIENRLTRNMPLQIDASVIYALGRHKTRVLYRDLQVDSPYNTYRNRGLPPGPIANPGKESLEAALIPESHDYLYYVAQHDGSHIFTRSYGEHQRAVRQARREIRNKTASEETPR